MSESTDYTKVPHVPSEHTVNFFNNFVINTTLFLDKFAVNCDKKLRHIHNSIERLEASINSLDAKLKFIKDADKVSESSASGVESDGPSSAASSSNKNEFSSLSDVIGYSDPRYRPYFEMLSSGVELPQVQLQMLIDGLDPSVLEKPRITSFLKKTELEDQ